ncbi:MAG TPA: hypothetical protein VJ870_15725 [Amycolatopsis sp.]|nr:hypothetical protein [Amycolatopsis sp.]
MRRRDDSGAALVLVLVLVTVLGLGIAGLLSFSDSSIRTTVALRDQSADSYNADGAMQAAINAIRNSTYNGTSGQCFGTGDTLGLDGFSAGGAKVTCETEAATILVQCPSLTNCNRPGNAILTLGKVAGEDGLNIQQNTQSTLRVHGNIFSNSNIRVVNGTLSTNTAVTARGVCTGTIQSSPAANCGIGSTANASGNDPGYQPNSATVPTYRSMSALNAQCTAKGPNSVIVFQPGYYDDAQGLSTMMAGNSACKHSTWWFKAGSYYFDFHNSGTGANPLLLSGTNVWTVDDGYLVAGTPANGASAPAVPASIPGACVSPMDKANIQNPVPGVQFVFGNDSQLSVKSGQAEICGSYDRNNAPVAVYGLTSGGENTTGPATLKLTGAAAGNQFTNPAFATDPDTNSATWTPTGNGNGNNTGVLNVTGFVPASTVPAGSALASTLTVNHMNAAGSKNDIRTVTITPKSAAGTAGTPIVVTLPTYDDNLWHTDTIDLSGTSAFAAFVHENGYSGATVSYSAALKNNGTESVDAIQLSLKYTAPAYRANAGCVTAGPYTGVGSSATCAMVTSVNSSGNQFYIQGTTYAPKAALDITLNNAAEQVFRFGVVARTLWVKLTGSFSYTGVVIEVPDDSPGYAFGVYLTAYLCPVSSSCPASLRSKVSYVDAPTGPVAGKRQVVVLSWARPR